MIILRNLLRIMNGFWKVIGVVGSISSIIGIGLAFYFYTQTIEKREPFFISDPVRTSLIEANRVKGAPFKIFRLDGSEIKKDVSSATVYFWNQGKKTIWRNNVLDSLVVALPGNCEILEFKIVGQSREICEFELSRIDSQHIKIDFKLAEELDGIMAQITYVGESSVPISINGSIEGVKQFNQSFQASYRTEQILVGLAIFFGFFAVIFGTFFVANRFDKESDLPLKEILRVMFKEKWWLGLLVSAIGIATSIGLTYELVQDQTINQFENVIPQQIKKQP